MEKERESERKSERETDRERENEEEKEREREKERKERREGEPFDVKTHVSKDMETCKSKKPARAGGRDPRR